MSDTTDDDLARSEFEDAKRSIDSVDRSSGDATVNAATAVAAGGGPAADLVPDEAADRDGSEGASGDLGLSANDELTDGDGVR